MATSSDQAGETVNDGTAKTSTRTVGYVFNRELLVLANQLPEVRGRALLVHQLIAAYGLLQSLAKINVTPASDEELRQFHSAEYIDFVRELSTLSSDDYDETTEERCEQFGLGYDCPPIPRLHRCISLLAASSMAAAKALVNKQCHIALNWFGGWHHGRRDEAAGFCYTNDIVFAILTFLQHGFRVLYCDLDLHHADAVEDAFAHTDKVVTLSLHKYEFGFFPGTGALSDVGLGNKGKYHAINMPLADGADDLNYTHCFSSIITRLIPRFKPQVIVCQCGGDALSGDRMNSFNLTLGAYEHCVRQLMAMHSGPMLFLGGGGYHNANTARLWTMITALCLDQRLDESIPEHDYLMSYGPSYELSVTASLRPNQNTAASIAASLQTISANIEQIKMQ